MTPKTAYLLHDNLPGYNLLGQGLTRCYKLSEPADFDGDGIFHEYAIVRLLYRTEHTSAHVSVFPGDEYGSIAEVSVKGRIGTFTLKGCPSQDRAYFDGCFAMALGLNGFTIVDPPEPKPMPVVVEPAFANGLDYDPNEVPTYE